MDEAQLPLHKCTMLLAISPSAEEADVLRAYDGDVSLLGLAERYFMELIQVPRLPARLQSWEIKQRLGAQVSELAAALERLRGGLRALLTSEGLHELLGVGT